MKKGFGWLIVIIGIIHIFRCMFMLTNISVGYGILFFVVGGLIVSFAEVEEDNKKKKAQYEKSGGKCYYLADRHNRNKPFTLEQLKDKDLTNESLIWTEGMDDWKMLKDIPELSYLLIKPKPASVPPPIPPQFQK